MIPCDHRLGKPGQDRGDLGAHLIYSDDHGQTWTLGAIDDSYEDSLNANETTLVELSDGRLYVNTRDQNGTARGNRGETFSNDGGQTFLRTTDGGFANFTPTSPILDTPVVQSALLGVQSKVADDGLELILFSGPDQNGPHGEGRTDLRIRLSRDDCQTWQDGPLVHRGPAAYSDLVDLGSGLVGILFEAGDAGSPRYDSIMFTVLDTNRLVIQK